MRWWKKLLIIVLVPIFLLSMYSSSVAYGSCTLQCTKNRFIGIDFFFYKIGYVYQISTSKHSVAFLNSTGMTRKQIDWFGIDSKHGLGEGQSILYPGFYHYPRLFKVWYGVSMIKSAPLMEHEIIPAIEGVVASEYREKYDPIKTDITVHLEDLNNDGRTDAIGQIVNSSSCESHGCAPKIFIRSKNNEFIRILMGYVIYPDAIMVTGASCNGFKLLRGLKNDGTTSQWCWDENSKSYQLVK